VVGSPSLAEQTQKTVHKLIDSTDPKGWDQQLKTEPVINLNYMRKKKIWRWGNPAGLSFDTAIDGNVGLGNLFTQVSAALEMRFGHNMPSGLMPSGLVIVGLHYERKNWGIHFSVMESSDNVDTNQAPAAENRERLGAIDIEWRF